MRYCSKIFTFADNTVQMDNNLFDMLKRKLLLSALFVLLALPSLAAGGKHDTVFLSAGINYPLTGGSVSVGRYFRLGYLYGEVGFDVFQRETGSFSSPELRAGYRLRALSVGNHTANLYIGLSGFVGTALLDTKNTETIKDNLSYGFSPDAEVEVFIARPLALFVGCSYRYRFADTLNRNRFCLNGGLRFAF